MYVEISAPTILADTNKSSFSVLIIDLLTDKIIWCLDSSQNNQWGVMSEVINYKLIAKLSNTDIRFTVFSLLLYIVENFHNEV
jgi:hypothetical protein